MSEWVQNLTDRVYHFTSSTHLKSILADGLKPLDEVRGSGVEWREMELFMDAVRPKQIKDMDISRLAGVFAHPDILPINFKAPTGFYRKLTEGCSGVVLEVAVNPEQAWVFDADSIGAICDEYACGNSPYAKHLAEKYWDETMSLSDYRRYYAVETTPFGNTITKMPNAPDRLPYKLLSPEVILPSPVLPDRIQWVASRLITAAGY